MPKRPLRQGFLCDLCDTIGPMDRKNHGPTQQDRYVAQIIDDVVVDLLNGEINGIGLCATRTDGGDPIFFYLDKSKESALRVPLSRLVGLYSVNERFRRRITAPPTNRSYMVH